ncbi:MAG: Poly-beta,6-N-acetyl-D-glucosamine synthase [Verrucomicrobiota bacterium]|jgi:cellulose synthase/poly-beta-1,6-N-acetylglucosamine synthase-like glycosyltransferase
MATAIFFICAGAVVYSYAGFPVLLALFTPRRVAPPVEPRAWPTVTILLSVFNEEKHVAARLKNFFELDYPADKLDIIVGSDGSEDGTDAILAACTDARLRFERVTPRGGKPRVLNRIAAMAQGELLVFTDANTFFERDALKKLARHFSDLDIGGVCGRLVFVGPEAETDEGAYWKLETFLKTRESHMDSCLGANGGIYAIRRRLWPTIPDNTFVDDFVIGMRVREQGGRVVYDPEAVATEDLPVKVSAELTRRIRIGAGGFQALGLCWRSLLLWRGAYAWAFWSHKVLRWFGPFFLLGALAANFFLPVTWWAVTLLGLQIIFYTLAGIGAVRREKKFIFSAPHYFVVINVALLLGFFRFVTRTQRAAWRRTTR